MSPEEFAAENAKRAPSNQASNDFCPARKRTGDQAGEQCRRAKGEGTSHPGFGYCSSHGGNTPSGKKAAARSYGRQLILDQKERFGGDRTSHYVRNITAEQALLEEVRRSVAMVRWLEERIGSWSVAPTSGPDLRFANDTDDSDVDHSLSLPRLVVETSKGSPGATDVQAWLLLYREERKHMAMVSKMCIDANISKRMVDIATNQGEVLQVVIRDVLKALNLTHVQAQQVPMVVPQVIRRATLALEPTDRQANGVPRESSAATPYKVTDLT